MKLKEHARFLASLLPSLASHGLSRESENHGICNFLETEWFMITWLYFSTVLESVPPYQAMQSRHGLVGEEFLECLEIFEDCHMFGPTMCEDDIDT